MRASSRRPPAVSLVVACALWGAATVLNKALLTSLPPATLLALQLAASAALLWILIVSRGARLPGRALLAPILLLGLLNPGVSYTLGLMGLARTSAGVATLLWAAEPLMITALAALLLSEPVTKHLLLVITLGFVGALMVAGVGPGLLGAGNDPIGVLQLFLGVLCCAGYTVGSRKLSDRVDPLTTVALQQTAGLAWAVGLLLAQSGSGAVGDAEASSLRLLALAALSGLSYYAAAYWLYLTALRSVTAAMAGGYFNLIPVFGVGLAYGFLDERLTPIQWVGAGTILASALGLVMLTGDEQKLDKSS